MRKPIKKILYFKILTLQNVKFEMSENNKTTFLSILVFCKYHLDNQGLAAQNIKKICLILSYSDSYKRSGSFLLQHLQPLSLYRYIYIMCQQELIVVACFYVKNIQQLRDTIIQLCSFMKPTKFFLQHYVYKIFFDTKKELQTHLAQPKKSE